MRALGAVLLLAAVAESAPVQNATALRQLQNGFQCECLSMPLKPHGVR